MTAVQRRYGPTGPTGPGVTGPTGPTGLDNFSVNLTSADVLPINTFDKNLYTVVNYVIRAQQDDNAVASEFKVLHNGIDIDWTEYASLNIGTLEITFTASIVEDEIVLYAQCLTASSETPVEVKIIRTKF